MATTPDTRATIIDVAREAGIAVSSASSALNDRPGVSEKTRQRVKDVAAQLGYVASVRGRSLSAQRAFAVGLVVERDFDVLESDPFFGAFIGGIEESLSPHGYVLALSLTQEPTTTLSRNLDLVRSKRVDGLFLNELMHDDPRVAALADAGAIAVGVNAPQHHFPFPAVREDGVAAITELIETFIALGHRRIAHVSGPPAYVHSRERQGAFARSLAAHNLPSDLVADGRFTYEGGRIAADILLTGEHRPTAVFCANDQSAIGFLNRAVELGFSVPGDVSIAGFDGNSIGRYVRPELATIRTSPRSLGREAARLLLSAIERGTVDDVTLPPARLVIRDSIARVAS